jgi:hypothetical protein
VPDQLDDHPRTVAASSLKRIVEGVARSSGTDISPTTLMPILRAGRVQSRPLSTQNVANSDENLATPTLDVDHAVLDSENPIPDSRLVRPRSWTPAGPTPAAR